MRSILIALTLLPLLACDMESFCMDAVSQALEEGGMDTCFRAGEIWLDSCGQYLPGSGEKCDTCGPNR